MPTEHIAGDEALKRSYGQKALSIASGQNAVVDVRGMVGLTAWFAGTCTATPVNDAAGTAIAGAVAAQLTSGVRLDASAHYYKVAPAGGAAVVHVIG